MKVMIRYRRSPVIDTEIDGTALYLRVTPERWVALDGTSLAIWNEMENPSTVSEIEQRLAGRYDAERGQIALDVEAALREWTELGLVTSDLPRGDE
jgi:hypothetical protein